MDRKEEHDEGSIKLGPEKFPLCPVSHSGSGRKKEPGLELAGSFRWAPNSVVLPLHSSTSLSPWGHLI